MMPAKATSPFADAGLHAFGTAWNASPAFVEAWAARAEGATLFAGPLFQMALRDAFAMKSLPALAVYQGHDLVGMLPLCRHAPVRGMLGLRESGFARNAHTLRNNLLTADPAVVMAMLRVWRDEVDADTLLLEHLPLESVLADFIAANVRSLHLLADAPTSGRTLHFSATNIPYDDYIASRSGQFRHQIRKRLRELQEAGDFQIDRLAGSELRAGLPDWRAVVDQSWQGQDSELGSANTAADWSLHASLARNGVLWLARLDARPIAALRMLEDAHGAYVHTMHFDQSMRKHAPGLVLFDAMMRDACARQLQRVDFNGTSPFFARWATGSTAQMSIRIYRNNIRGRCAQNMRSLLRRLRPPIDVAPEILPAPQV